MARKLVQDRLFRRRTNKVTRFNNDVAPSVERKSHFVTKLNLFKRASREDWIRDGTFHDAVGGLLATAQLFAVMPVCGVTAKDPRRLHFSWFSKRALYTYVGLAGTAFIAVNAIIRFLMKNFNFNRLTTVFFYSYNLYGMYRFLLLARKWPKLMQSWYDAEQTLPQMGNVVDRGALAWKIKMISLLVITMSLTEHLISIIAAVYYTSDCPDIGDPVDFFFKSNFVFIFHYFEYSKVRGFFIKYINVLCTFLWSYIDLFVIVISIGLSHTLKRINEYLMKHKRERMSEQFWGEQRQNYRNICDLIQKVDDVVSIITMLSISNNLFFICVSILQSLNSHPTFVHTVYFWLGLIFLIGRTLAVSMYAAEVNDESKRPIEVLRTIPRDGWCLEAKRFAEEVVNDTVALTGMKFFNMTRKLVLKVTGSIITYELVLIQFHQDEPVEVNLCKMKRF